MPAVETIRRPVAITHKQVGAGHVFQHEGEVFAAGQRPGLRVDLVGPDHRGRSRSSPAPGSWPPGYGQARCCAPAACRARRCQARGR
ncbi:hypothetical protein G6F59_015424 [Rhizopus arrhizus]|nr:hypothetical protein G6F59_015424 [Rhizopus arrhizus]